MVVPHRANGILKQFLTKRRFISGFSFSIWLHFCANLDQFRAIDNATMLRTMCEWHLVFFFCLKHHHIETGDYYSMTNGSSTSNTLKYLAEKFFFLLCGRSAVWLSAVVPLCVCEYALFSVWVDDVNRWLNERNPFPNWIWNAQQ